MQPFLLTVDAREEICFFDPPGDTRTDAGASAQAAPVPASANAEVPPPRQP